MRLGVSEFDTYFLFQGRRYAKGERLFLNHSGASVLGKFKGTELVLRVFSEFSLSDRNAYIRVTMDGKTRRVRLPKGEKTIAVRAEEGAHVFEVVKLTESANNSFALFSAETDGAFLPQEKTPALKIEFIGDSITTGFGTLAPFGNGEYKTKEQDVTKAFSYLTAKALGADYNVIAAGGWPIYKSVYSDHSIPEIYENVDFFRNEEKWDFSSFVPDVVVITLGTNDFSYLSEFSGEKREAEKEKVTEIFTEFIKRVAEKNERAKIILLCGFFEKPELLPLTIEAKERVGSPRVSVLETPSAASMSDVRAGHPGRICHRIAARRLVEAIKKSGSLHRPS